MNLNDIAKWLQEMQTVVPGLRLEMASFEGGGVLLSVRWMHDEKLMGYQHAIGGLELRNMVSGAQRQVLDVIRIRVEDSKRHNA